MESKFEWIQLVQLNEVSKAYGNKITGKWIAYVSTTPWGWYVATDNGSIHGLYMDEESAMKSAEEYIAARKYNAR